MDWQHRSLRANGPEGATWTGRAMEVRPGNEVIRTVPLCAGPAFTIPMITTHTQESNPQGEASTSVDDAGGVRESDVL